MNELDNKKIDHLLKEINPNAKTINLAELDSNEALARLETEFANSPDKESYIISIPSATPGQGQTVFQPVGRYLLAKKKSGALASCIPLTAGIGFYVETSTS